MNEVKVYKFISSNDGCFVYSKDPNFGQGSGWENSWEGFLTFDDTQVGVVPIYQYQATNPFRCQYSTNAKLADETWAYDYVAFHAFAVEPGGIISTPIYQLKSLDDPERYQYVTKGDASSGDGWDMKGEKIAFYVKAYFN